MEGPLWRWTSLPLRWFFDAFLATDWPELLRYSLLGLLVNLAVLGLVLGLDAGYQEASAAASARIYARIQRIRRGGVMADGSAGGRFRPSLPGPAWWGGLGPNLWRQMTTALRGIVRLLLVFAILGAVLIVPVLSDKQEASSLPARMAGLLIFLAVFLTNLVPFDFRGDLDRVAFLKTLPLPAWRLAASQLLTPVLILCAVQWAALVAASFFAPGKGGQLLAIGAFALPFNFVLFALENLLFLLFPSRQVGNTQVDFQSMGRNVLFLMSKLLAMGWVTVVAVAVGLAAWYLTRFTSAVAFLAAWLVVAAYGMALVPPVALAFRAFDVGRDTPA
jgi:hypothetical protein